ncbi:hypothetical protein HPB47_017224 [Ixodes persulcatus]|uniref:Uncharacterized protein n=1 Tax=Ixodes persulcatus TaxID=34615 RepID=A0AC60QNW1_IXOPE|nr:hypothetical protein HPB47_017224 [Ixodes persulcatus]
MDPKQDLPNECMQLNPYTEGISKEEEWIPAPARFDLDEHRTGVRLCITTACGTESDERDDAADRDKQQVRPPEASKDAPPFAPQSRPGEVPCPRSPQFLLQPRLPFLPLPRQPPPLPLQFCLQLRLQFL